MGLLGIIALALLFTWLFGSLLLRLGGLVLVFVGVIGLAASANADGVLIAAIGAVLWLLGHGHYALRRGVWKSHLAGWLWSAAGSAVGRLLGVAVGRLEAAGLLRREPGRERAEASEGV